MTAEELIKKAAACQDCDREHKYRQVEVNRRSWAALDGHSYRPVFDVGDVARLRYLVTGKYENPWAPEKSLIAKAADLLKA